MVPPEDIRLSFNETVECYDRIRPAYPESLFDDLFELLPPQPQILEVGPGTGQATADLLKRGAEVHGIEIGSAMAAKLQTNLESKRLRVSVGDFEECPAGTAVTDAVFAATAYHWIKPAAQLERPAALLRPEGVLAIVDLLQVDSAEDEGFFEACNPIYERYGQGHRGPPAPRRDEVAPPIRDLMANDDRFHSVSMRCYDWNQRYRATQYRDLMLSYSGTQMMARSDRLALLNEIEALIGRDFGGIVTRPLVVTLSIAVRSA